MNRIFFASLVATAALMTSVIGAPDKKPDFSGTWEIDSTRSESPHSGDSKSQVSMIVKQTADDITIETRREGQSEVITYKLDGSETEKPAPDNGPYKWRARWDGAKLTTETHRNINRATVTVLEVRDLSANGKEMNVERTLTVQHRYEMRGAKNYASAKDVFVKARQ